MSSATTTSLDEVGSVLPLDGVELDAAPGADVCGAAGCRETARLVRAAIEGFGQRVLCADHAARLIRREVL